MDGTGHGWAGARRRLSSSAGGQRNGCAEVQRHWRAQHQLRQVFRSVPCSAERKGVGGPEKAGYRSARTFLRTFSCARSLAHVRRRSSPRGAILVVVECPAGGATLDATLGAPLRTGGRRGRKSPSPMGGDLGRRARGHVTASEFLCGCGWESYTTSRPSPRYCMYVPTSSPLASRSGAAKV